MPAELPVNYRYTSATLTADIPALKQLAGSSKRAARFAVYECDYLRRSRDLLLNRILRERDLRICSVNIRDSVLPHTNGEQPSPEQLGIFPSGQIRWIYSHYLDKHFTSGGDFDYRTREETDKDEIQGYFETHSGEVLGFCPAHFPGCQNKSHNRIGVQYEVREGPGTDAFTTIDTRMVTHGILRTDYDEQIYQYLGLPTLPSIREINDTVAGR